jgi:hypothetical protein
MVASAGLVGEMAISVAHFVPYNRFWPPLHRPSEKVMLV